MCGIAGFIDRAAQSPQGHAMSAMTRAMAHRGPDDHGHWEDLLTGVRLGHRRLSILDLSSAGHQPMHSRTERFVITFNGEIYNFGELTEQLRHRGHEFRGHSDTEVMLAAFEEWGIERAVEKFNGMFAFGVWDRLNRTLTLCRDRMGEKPLYYGWNSGIFLFASELKSIRAHPKFQGSIDRSTLGLALRYSYIPAPWSIYCNVFKLVPGSLLTLKESELSRIPANFSPFADRSASVLHPRRYWMAPGINTSEAPVPYAGSEAQAIADLDTLLQDAVKIRMVSDVPVGAFLSGGVDSSTVVALMQAQSSQPVKTFSIGFTEKGYNEAAFAKEVAAHLGTDHTELYLTPRDILDVIPSLPQMFDEPFSDSSQIPTYLVSKLCATKVKVSLSGDGGDELFGGYERYASANRLWSGMKKFPPGLRSLASEFTGSPVLEQNMDRLRPLLSRVSRMGNPGQKVKTLSRVLGYRDRRSLYHGLMSHWGADAPLVIGSLELETPFSAYQGYSGQTFASEMMCLDMHTYLPDDIMVKVDRASMAVSLEARTPFLDHRLVEFASTLPLKFKFENGEARKKILRNVLDRYVPRALVERPKMGFAVPIAQWLRGELREWAEGLLSHEKISRQGILQPEPIRRKWKEHLSGSYNWEHHLWDILMFQSWLEREGGDEIDVERPTSHPASRPDLHLVEARA